METNNIIFIGIVLQVIGVFGILGYQKIKAFRKRKQQ